MATTCRRPATGSGPTDRRDRVKHMPSHPNAPSRVLAVNVGSSSLRIERWLPRAPQAETVLTAQGIGGAGGMIVTRGGDGEREDRAVLVDHRAALEALLGRLGTAPGVDYV